MFSGDSQHWATVFFTCLVLNRIHWPLRTWLIIKWIVFLFSDGYPSSTWPLLVQDHPYCQLPSPVTSHDTNPGHPFFSSRPPLTSHTCRHRRLWYRHHYAPTWPSWLEMISVELANVDSIAHSHYQAWPMLMLGLPRIEVPAFCRNSMEVSGELGKIWRNQRTLLQQSITANIDNEN